MSAVRVTKVEPEAALELVGLVAAQLRRLIGEATPTAPSLVYLLRGGLEEISEHGRPLDAFQVGLLRQSVWRGRRLDMAEAFNRLNPTFGVTVGAWCYPADLDNPQGHAAAQRRELELSMGERFARMLAPAHPGGEAT